MRFVVAFGPDILSEQAASTSAEIRLLARTLANYTLLAVTDEESQQIARDIRVMPQLPQAIWTELLVGFLAFRNLSLFQHGLNSGCRSAPNLPPLQLATRKSKTAACDRCGCPHTSWQDLDITPVVVLLEEWRRKNILEKGLSRSEVFERLFQRLLPAAKRVLLVDRYAGKNLIDTPANSGLGWLLAEFHSRSLKNVEVVTASFPNVTNGDIEMAVKACAGAMRTGVHTVSNKQFGKFAHDRFVVIDIGTCSIAASIGKGVEVFKADKVLQSTTFSPVDAAVVMAAVDSLGVRM